MLVSVLSFAVGVTPVLGQGTTAASGQASTAKAELGYVATMKKDLRTTATAIPRIQGVSENSGDFPGCSNAQINAAKS